MLEKTQVRDDREPLGRRQGKPVTECVASAGKHAMTPSVNRVCWIALNQTRGQQQWAKQWTVTITSPWLGLGPLEKEGCNGGSLQLLA